MLYDCMKWLVSEREGRISLRGFVLRLLGVCFVLLLRGAGLFDFWLWVGFFV